MGIAELGGFLAITLVAAFTQTVTGFAFGLMTMGAIGLTGLIPLPHAAVIVSFLALVNASQMMLRGWRLVLRRELGLILIASLPAIGIGYLLLGYLAERQSDALKLALGLVVMGSSLQLALSPRPLTRPSGDASYVAIGALSGVMSGLFAIGGPPLVYHLYRQPLPIARIRETLVAAFGTAAILRLGTVVAAGDLPPPSLAPALLAVPMVMLGTFLARRFPPPIPPVILRRIVFVLLFLSGASLALPAALVLGRP